MKFKTQFNSNEFPKQNEPGGGVSMTIPDQALTVPQIMERNRRGLSVPQAKETYHTHDENDQEVVPGSLIDPAKLDLTDLATLRQEQQQQITQLQLQLQEQNAALEKEKADKAHAELVEKLKAEMSKEPEKPQASAV